MIMNIKDLKELAYDTLAQIQNLQKQLTEINKQIAFIISKNKEEEKKVPVKPVMQVVEEEVPQPDGTNS